MDILCILERSWRCPISFELEDIDGIFQYDPVFRKRWNRSSVRIEVVQYILYY